jgi:hypothetical protein
VGTPTLCAGRKSAERFSGRANTPEARPLRGRWSHGHPSVSAERISGRANTPEARPLRGSWSHRHLGG